MIVVAWAAGIAFVAAVVGAVAYDAVTRWLRRRHADLVAEVTPRFAGRAVLTITNLGEADARGFQLLGVDPSPAGHRLSIRGPWPDQVVVPGGAAPGVWPHQIRLQCTLPCEHRPGRTPVVHPQDLLDGMGLAVAWWDEAGQHEALLPILWQPASDHGG